MKIRDLKASGAFDAMVPVAMINVVDPESESKGFNVNVSDVSVADGCLTIENFMDFEIPGIRTNDTKTACAIQVYGRLEPVYPKTTRGDL
jgi:hypothetical protein